MKIKHKNQLNNGVGKYKVLSSNAGVGSIVTSKWGGFIMPKSVSDWGFVKNAIQAIEYARRLGLTTQQFKTSAELQGIQLVEDERFIEYLRTSESLSNLFCMVGIPHLNLDADNKCDIDNHPMVQRLRRPGVNFVDSDFVIPSIIFPRWFYSKKMKFLYPIEKWKDIWMNEERCNGNRRRGDINSFAPPRDPYAKTTRPLYGENDNKRVYEPLEQLAMALICPNGHISDIDWYKYFCAKINITN